MASSLQVHRCSSPSSTQSCKASICRRTKAIISATGKLQAARERRKKTCCRKACRKSSPNRA